MAVIRSTLILFAALALALAACGVEDAPVESPDVDAALEDTPPPAPDTPEPAPDTPDPTVALDDEALERIADAAANTVDEGTARFTVTVETQDVTGTEGRQTVQADGEADFNADRRSLEFPLQQGTMRAIVDDAALYAQLPDTAGDQWARVQLDDVVRDDVALRGPGVLLVESPRDNLEMLRDLASDAREVGRDDVGGAATTHYELTIDLDRASDTARDRVPRTLDRYRQQAGESQIDMEVWVDDDDDVIRRIAYTLDLAQADVDVETDDQGLDTEPRGTLTVEIEYFDFGAPVDISVPDAQQVIDLDMELLRRSMEQTD
jgi:hypothetical protein